MRTVSQRKPSQNRRQSSALYIVRDFRQDAAPQPGYEIVAHGFFARDGRRACGLARAGKSSETVLSNRPEYHFRVQNLTLQFPDLPCCV
jgi:hypothetical protein